MQPYSQYVTTNMFGAPQLRTPRRRTPNPMWSDSSPLVAAHIGGQMPHPFGYGEVEQGALPPREVSINLVLIADTDFISDAFYNLYRSLGDDGPGNQRSLPELSGLRNVQFMDNVLDTMLDDTELVPLRARRPQHRSLTRWENQRNELDSRRIDRLAALESEREDAVRRARAEFDARVQAIAQRSDLNPRDREEKKAFVGDQAQRVLQRRIDQLARSAEEDMRRTEAAHRDGLKRLIWINRLVTLLLPACVLAILVLSVAWWRWSQEQMDIPSSRRKA